jgi:hypothetical protein
MVARAGIEPPTRGLSGSVTPWLECDAKIAREGLQAPVQSPETGTRRQQRGGQQGDVYGTAA